MVNVEVLRGVHTLKNVMANTDIPSRDSDSVNKEIRNYPISLPILGTQATDLFDSPAGVLAIFLVESIFRIWSNTLV